MKAGVYFKDQGLGAIVFGLFLYSKVNDHIAVHPMFLYMPFG